ncbi:hypothetical protein [uncultured Porphyromonas sp.]|uniref:hypothetical protein n=1 Tax=uncultured Porphyromonas sp. TaxID=159274 RepID=UPI00259BC780|nr:hypothetical protein [uncultured Porphyromonas sp.]
MSEFGWIKLHRRITEWHHWSSPNVLATFIHLLTLANYEPKEWNGIVVQRGQLVTSERNFAEEVGIARSTLRRVLLLLQETGEIEMEIVTVGDRKECSLITIINYNEYQGDFSTSQSESVWTTSDTTDSENRGPRAIPRKDTINTSISQQRDDECEPRSQVTKAGGVDRTKEYIRNNIYSISTTTTRDARESESEILDGSEPRTNHLNTGDDFEERKKVAAKKERSEYQDLQASNASAIQELKANSHWIADTATLCEITEAEVHKKLTEFELNSNTRFKRLQMPDAYNHFQRWLRLNRDIERRRTRAKPQQKSKPGAVSDFWSSPEAKAIEERNRREGEELMKKYKINEI